MIQVTSIAHRQERHKYGNDIIEHRKNHMKNLIQARTTIISSSYCTPHELCSYNMTSIKGRLKHSRHSAESETNNDPETRHESHSRMLQNHPS